MTRLIRIETCDECPYGPDRPKGERYDIHLFGLRSGTDRERSYIPDLRSPPGPPIL